MPERKIALQQYRLQEESEKSRLEDGQMEKTFILMTERQAQLPRTGAQALE